jgi:hypothetical protein
MAAYRVYCLDGVNRIVRANGLPQIATVRRLRPLAAFWAIAPSAKFGRGIG